MNVKKTILHALVSAILASIACVIYNNIYSKAFEVNFSGVLTVGGAVGACVFGSLLMAAAYFFALKWKGDKLIGWVNVLITILSFASIVGVFGFQLPLTIESPEMFAGLAIPMHFFPALAFFTVAPFFKSK